MHQFRTGWYLMYTKPKHERKIYARLSEMEIESFLPTRKSLRQWHDRKKYIDEPLFPGYLFTYLKDQRAYYEGMETEGYLYYVRSGKEVARVADSVVDSLKIAVAYSREIEVSKQVFKPGQQMVIREGALTGLSCELIEVGSTQKLLVRIELLQRSLLLTLPASNLMIV
ncbi:MAG: UpxY family transcription antiterminator [Bacteroidetes bacterium]|nr:UpxY family transcription antiterminator [Bacteroidota bacterium]